MNRQREAIYTDRRAILEGNDLQEKVGHFLEDVVKAMVVEATQVGNPDEWDLKQLWLNLKQLYPIGITLSEVTEEAGGVAHLSAQFLEREILSDAQYQYELREKQIGSSVMRDLERRVVLSTIGRKWQEHLYEMDYLKEGIGLRAMAQRDPLVEYQREGYTMFLTMMEGIREESIGTLFNLDVPTGAEEAAQAGPSEPAPATNLQYTGPDEDGHANTTREPASNPQKNNKKKKAKNKR